MDRRSHWIFACVCLPLAVVGLLPHAAGFTDTPKPSAGWTTYRGNPQRTANTDGVAGPTAPKVLWAFKSKEHFVAAPVPADDRLYVSSFGAFAPTFLCLATDPKAAQRTLWSKSGPYLTLPSVSSPALVDGKILFGDGMHQNDGATLHALNQDKGLFEWELKLPGTLVHLEGSPTVADGKVYLGGGAAGVICVDLNRLTLDGKQMDRAAIQKVLDQKWAELEAKYEIEKKKDPELAVKPAKDQLPRPSPVKLWEQGKEKWHVDAPVTVLGDRVLAASAFLDKEKAGDRALFCLDAKTGEQKWRTPLTLNPWGGPSVQGDLVVVSGSSIGYDPKALKGAKGDLAAYDLATGKEKWRKEIPAGVVSCAALTPELAVVTATDGKVRAFELATGDRRWIYDAKAPLFAPVAVAGSVVYAGDLKGVVHAVNLTDGTEKWKLDLAADPDVKAPGSIYAGPSVHGGRVFVATCNLAGAAEELQTAVVCIGEK
jgi:outer membrane protein assembly factor BamB